METAPPVSFIVDAPEAQTMATGINPMEIRWGFNPVQRDKILTARDCGLHKIPFGRFFAIERFNTRREFHTTDELLPRENLTTVSATEAEDFIKDSLGGTNAQVTTNWGLKVGFYGENDRAKMEVMTQTLLPTLSRIVEICEKNTLALPISQVCEGTDEMDFGRRETCVTCWNRWLLSDSCAAYGEMAAANGIVVGERSAATGEVVNRRIFPSIDELDAARNLMIDAYRTGIKTLQSVWREVAVGEEKGERKAANDFENQYRKDLHENKTQDRQITMVEKFAQASSAGVGGNNELIQMLAQSQIQTNQMLAQMLANGQPQQIAPQPAAAIADTEPELSEEQTKAANEAWAAKMAKSKTDKSAKQ